MPEFRVTAMRAVDLLSRLAGHAPIVAAERLRPVQSHGHAGAVLLGPLARQREPTGPLAEVRTGELILGRGARSLPSFQVLPRLVHVILEIELDVMHQDLAGSACLSDVAANDPLEEVRFVPRVRPVPLQGPVDVFLLVARIIGIGVEQIHEA